ncbi:hypothetical protein [Fructobacillus americanaquae]|uniref:DUF4177 domain-containing protein n=1 Tax=Fructobacillus americanaquae TaxID=2940302 RepID=A0ABY5C1G6_9LACO|nr:hypothetical protein [Fructobacillus americanaquae]USS92018.1 hypothetical protein M3M36_06820 [Fructobacillus americanaquae]
MDYKVVEIYEFATYSTVTRAETTAKRLGRIGWRLISTVYTDDRSIVLFFERSENDEED